MNNSNQSSKNGGYYGGGGGSMMRRLLEEKRYNKLIKERAELEAKLLTGSSTKTKSEDSEQSIKKTKKASPLNIFNINLSSPNATDKVKTDSEVPEPKANAPFRQPATHKSSEPEQTSFVPPLIAEISQTPSIEPKPSKSEFESNTESHLDNLDVEPGEITLPPPVMSSSHEEPEVDFEWLESAWQTSQNEPIISAEEIEELLRPNEAFQDQLSIAEPDKNGLKQPTFTEIVPEIVKDKLAVHEEHAATEDLIETEAKKIRLERATERFELIAAQIVEAEGQFTEPSLVEQSKDAEAELVDAYSKLLRKIGIEDETEMRTLIEDYLEKIWQRARETEAVEMALGSTDEEVFFERQIMEDPELSRSTTRSPSASLSNGLTKAASRIGRFLGKLTIRSSAQYQSR